MKKQFVVRSGAAIVILLGMVSIWWAKSEGPLRNPKEALQDFFRAKDRAEDQLMDPLILNGHKVVPLVIQELPNKEMKLRRYALGFLGNGRYSEALPILESILRDKSEIYYFRADALQAIYQISKNHAEELAPLYINGPELLGRVASDIVAGKSLAYFKRSYWDAFCGVHY